MKTVFDIIYNSDVQYIKVLIINRFENITYKYEMYHNNKEIFSRETCSKIVDLKTFHNDALSQIEIFKKIKHEHD